MKIKQLFTLALAAGISATSMAGTTYNLEIKNNASLTYSVEGTTQTDIEVLASESFRVDRKVIFTLTQVNNTITPSNIGSEQVIEYTLINTSNAPIRFFPEVTDLTGGESAYAGAATDNTAGTKVTNYQVHYEDVGDGFGSGTSETNITSNLGYVELEQDEQITLYVVTTPTIGENLDIFVHNLKISAQNHTDTVNDIPTATAGTLITASSGEWKKELVQTVLDTDAGGAIRSDNGAIQVGSATLKMDKSVKVLTDPFGNSFPNAKAIPGAVVEYTLTVTNSGLVEAKDVIISDDVPANGFDLSDSYVELFSVTDNAGTTNPTVGSGVTVGTATATETPVTFAAVTVPANDGTNDGQVVVTLTATLK